MFQLKVIVLLLAGLLAHQFHAFHTSISEIEFNAKEKTIEASIRVFSDDFEKALMKENGGVKIIGLSKEKLILLTENYLKKHFGLLNAQRQRKTSNYVGQEIEGDATWLYLEIPFNEKIEGCAFQNDILFEVFDDQTNLINFKYNNTKSSLLFKGKKTILAIE